MVDETRVQQLVTLGLSQYEACAYLALLGYDESSAVEVADRAGVPRQRVYDVLASLRERGLVVTKDGRPLRHTAREPGVALSALLEARRRQQQAENERLAALVEAILAELAPAANGRSERHPTAPPQDQSQEPVGGF